MQQNHPYLDQDKKVYLIAGSQGLPISDNGRKEGNIAHAPHFSVKVSFSATYVL